MISSKIKYSDETILPNSFFAEQSVLNLLLTNSSLIDDILPDLKPNSFYFPPHKIIYETICELNDNNTTINLPNIITRLQDKNCLKKIGGIEQIITILNRFENFADLPDYVKQINEKYLRRLIIELGKQFITWGYTTSEDIDEILEKIEHAVYSLNQENKYQKIYSISEIIDDVFQEMKGKIKKQTNVGLKTAFKDLDSIVQGFQKSDLIIIAGRPSMGKTAFSLNLAKNIVENYNIPLVIFTLEMSRQQIIYRFIAYASEINTNRLKSGKMSSLEWKTLSKTMKMISELPIFIDDNPNLNLTDIRSKLRKVFKDKNKTGLVIIDYLQLMKLNFKLENRVQEISYLTRNLKILAKEFEIPIIVLSQLSRNVESRTNKRPMLSDLRESGCFATQRPFSPLSSYCWLKSSLKENKESLNFLKGIKPTFSVKVNKQTKIQTTSNHKILSKFGWIKLSQLTALSDLYTLEKFQNYKINQNFRFHKIVEIKYGGIKKVFDKTIPFYHNYLKNNFILHNSIEQDADIVIMLYREDYYNDKTSTTDHLTEFIIAKHRNGPVGTAKLIFDPTITAFKNLKN
jgi:replicative DNA helicase